MHLHTTGRWQLFGHYSCNIALSAANPDYGFSIILKQPPRSVLILEGTEYPGSASESFSLSLSLSVSLFLWLSPTRRVIIVVLRHYVRFSSRDQTCRLEQSCVGKIFEKRNNFSRYNAPVPLIRGNIGRRNLITREREREKDFQRYKSAFDQGFRIVWGIRNKGESWDDPFNNNFD